MKVASAAAVGSTAGAALAVDDVQTGDPGMQAAAVTEAQLVVHWVLTSPTQHRTCTKVASAAAAGSTAGAAGCGRCGQTR